MSVCEDTEEQQKQQCNPSVDTPTQLLAVSASTFGCCVVIRDAVSASGYVVAFLLACFSEHARAAHWKNDADRALSETL